MQNERVINFHKKDFTLNKLYSRIILYKMLYFVVFWGNIYLYGGIDRGTECKHTSKSVIK